MSVPDLAVGLVQIAALVLAPLLAGAVQTLKGRLQGRRGPSPLQPYRELRRLWHKSGVQPKTAGPVYRVAPAIVVAGLVVAMLLVPIAGHGPDWGLGSDAIVVVGLLAVSRLAIALAAWDTTSGFALMGASRDLTFAVFAEAVLLLVLLLAGVSAGGSTDLQQLSAAAAGSEIWQHPIHWCAGAAFLLVALAETGRHPVDNPDTHLELTMVHEGPLLEYAGRDLAALQWASAARLWLMAVLAIGLFLPSTGPFGLQLLIGAGELVLLVVAVALTETLVVKMRILRVPLFLSGAAALCFIGLGTALATGTT
ncbi:MAG: NADH-quinone oxidoreductase subunit H [Patulibacter sp.]|nr:NADH-quinone oxidoreductase subunit H [Patulibacter sp.]